MPSFFPRSNFLCPVPLYKVFESHFQHLRQVYMSDNMEYLHDFMHLD